MARALANSLSVLSWSCLRGELTGSRLVALRSLRDRFAPADPADPQVVPPPIARGRTIARLTARQYTKPRRCRRWVATGRAVATGGAGADGVAQRAGAGRAARSRRARPRPGARSRRDWPGLGGLRRAGPGAGRWRAAGAGAAGRAGAVARRRRRASAAAALRGRRRLGRLLARSRPWARLPRLRGALAVRARRRAWPRACRVRRRVGARPRLAAAGAARLSLRRCGRLRGSAPSTSGGAFVAQGST